MPKKRAKLKFPSGKKLQFLTLDQVQQMVDELHDSVDGIRDVVRAMQTFKVDALPSIPQDLYKMISEELPRKIRKELRDRVEELTGENL